MILKVIYFLSLVTTVIYVIFYIKKSFDINLKYFLAFLLAMCLLEIVASFVKRMGFYNLIVYNILTLLEFNFLLLFIKNILNSSKSKKIINFLLKIFNIIYTSSSLYYIWINSYLSTYNSVASIIGSILVSIAVFLFLRDFLNSDKILNYWKTLSFWISFGLLIYYLGTIPFTSIMNFISNITLESKLLLIKIQYLLTTLMYTCFIFGALWGQKILK